jgi:hypothetical protein
MAIHSARADVHAGQRCVRAVLVCVRRDVLPFVRDALLFGRDALLFGRDALQFGRDALQFGRDPHAFVRYPHAFVRDAFQFVGTPGSSFCTRLTSCGGHWRSCGTASLPVGATFRSVGRADQLVCVESRFFGTSFSSLGTSTVRCGGMVVLVARRSVRAVPAAACAVRQ